MKRFLVRFTMVTLLVIGLGLIHESFEPFVGNINLLWYAVPCILLGGGYFIGNIIRAERKHRAA